VAKKPQPRTAAHIRLHQSIAYCPRKHKNVFDLNKLKPGDPAECASKGCKEELIVPQPIYSGRKRK
jgi:hypothetical protein